MRITAPLSKCGERGLILFKLYDTITLRCRIISLIVELQTDRPILSGSLIIAIRILPFEPYTNYEFCSGSVLSSRVSMSTVLVAFGDKNSMKYSGRRLSQKPAPRAKENPHAGVGVGCVFRKKMLWGYGLPPVPVPLPPEGAGAEVGRGSFENFSAIFQS